VAGRSAWQQGQLIEQMQAKFSKYPGLVFGFSQTIQDNVEEAMSGVKGENSMKLLRRTTWMN